MPSLFNILRIRSDGIHLEMDIEIGHDDAPGVVVGQGREPINPAHEQTAERFAGAVDVGRSQFDQLMLIGTVHAGRDRGFDDGGSGNRIRNVVPNIFNADTEVIRWVHVRITEKMDMRMNISSIFVLMAELCLHEEVVAI